MPTTATHAVPADPRDAALAALADRCVMCGLCLPHCPTFALSGVEGESPRGRIALIKLLAEARMTLDAAASAHLEQCLGCRRCESVCPAEVPYAELWQGARQRWSMHTRESLASRWLKALIAHPRVLFAALRIGSGALRVLPKAWQRRLPRLGRLLSVMADATPARQALSSLDSPQLWVASACVSGAAELALQRRLIAALRRMGVAAEALPAGACCGAMHTHSGQAAPADPRLDPVLRSRSGQALDAAGACVLSTASGCHSSWAQRVAPLTVQDATAFVWSLRERWPPLHRKPQRALWYAPCSQRAGNWRAAPLALLTALPGLRVDPVTATHGCCGAAGQALLDEGGRAVQLREGLLEAIAAAQPDVVLTSNIGCAMHLREGLLQRGLDIPVRHPLECWLERIEEN